MVFDINNWQLFILLFGLSLLITYIMNKLSRHFYTRDMVVRKFSIMELELPATPNELVSLIRGLYTLPAAQSGKAIDSLRGHLSLGFVFMPLAYGAVFLLCWKIAHKMHTHAGYYVFLSLAFVQFIAWICDIIGNIYLLKKISPSPQMTSSKLHKFYLTMEAVKWALVLIAMACSVSAVCYYWMSGDYSEPSFRFLLIAAGEMLVFVLAKIYL